MKKKKNLKKMTYMEINIRIEKLIDTVKSISKKKKKTIRKSYIMYLIWLRLLVIFHHLGILGFLVSAPMLMIKTPFWVWLPLNTWILHLIFSPVLVCPLTIWENRLRKKLGWEKIDTFFKHYYIRPYKRWRQK